MTALTKHEQARWWHRFTGGRPMVLVGFAFTDVVSGRPVSYWRDAFGKEWLAEGPWSSFRVARPSIVDDLIRRFG